MFIVWFGVYGLVAKVKEERVHLTERSCNKVAEDMLRIGVIVQEHKSAHLYLDCRTLVHSDISR